MELAEKLALLEEIFEAEAGTLSEYTSLEELRYDSMARLMLIAMFKSQFGKSLTMDDLQSFQIIGDILKMM